MKQYYVANENFVGLFYITQKLYMLKILARNIDIIKITLKNLEEWIYFNLPIKIFVESFNIRQNNIYVEHFEKWNKE